MKKLPFVLAGILAPVYYFLIFTLLMYLFGTNTFDSIYISFAVIYILPALPGIVLIFALRCDSPKAFPKGLLLSFVISCCMFLAFRLSGLGLSAYRHFTGYDEYSLGEGVLIVEFFFVYVVSCAIGAAISAVITAKKQQTYSK